MLCFWVTNHIYIVNCNIHHLGNSFNLNLKTKMWNVANWLPKFDGILISTLGPIQGDKVQHLLVAWGRLECFFSFNLDSLCKALGVDFNSYTNKNTGFQLNVALTSSVKQAIVMHSIFCQIPNNGDFHVPMSNSDTWV